MIKKIQNLKRWQQLTLIWITGVLFFLILPLIPTISGIILFALIWLYPRKDETFFRNRFKDFKNYKLRIVLSCLLMILILGGYAGIEEREKQEAFIENYPVPEITIVSDTGFQKSQEYTIEFVVTDHEKILLNGKELSTENESFIAVVPLPQSKTRISIIAKNLHKESKKEVIIERQETEEEKIEREKQEKEAEEQKRIEEEVRAAEEKRRQEEERLAEEKRLLGKNKYIAIACAQERIESMLKSPKSADFPWGIDAVPMDGKYAINSYVDAQNSFGAEIRTYYICSVEVTDSKNHRCRTECSFFE